MLIVILIMLIISCIVLGKSLFNLFDVQMEAKRFFSWQSFLRIIFVYFISILAFSSIYLGLYLLDVGEIIFHRVRDPINIDGGSPFIAALLYLGDIIYFSAMTMLTVGYGDMTPAGMAKIFAIIQALIGYLIPVGFVLSGLYIVLDTAKMDKTEETRARDLNE